MSGFVLDASCAIAALLSDEAGPESDAILRRISVETPWVPTLWFAEVGNSLEMARRRRRITATDLNEVLETIAAWRLSVDREDPTILLPRIMSLAAGHMLTVYDATYMELAGRLSVPLATFDASLAREASQVGISLLA
ncbi:MAG: type II toxin-antitoxin system VapC family toxin [Parvibaculaceae bacterium]